jgi:hypothetical protein
LFIKPVKKVIKTIVRVIIYSRYPCIDQSKLIDVKLNAGWKIGNDFKINIIIGSICKNLVKQ